MRLTKKPRVTLKMIPSFIPYEKVKPDNVVGVVVWTKNPETLEKVQKNPEKARNYIKKYDRLYQQVVIIN